MSPNAGYIALVSAVIIAILLITISFALSFSGFFSRFNILDNEYKEQATGLAEACGETAILRLATDPAYNPVNEVVNVGSDSCLIKSLQKDSPGTGQATIKTQGVVPQTGARRSFSNIQIVVDSTTFAIISWEEVNSLP